MGGAGESQAAQMAIFPALTKVHVWQVHYLLGASTFVTGSTLRFPERMRSIAAYNDEFLH